MKTALFRCLAVLGIGIAASGQTTPDVSSLRMAGTPIENKVGPRIGRQQGRIQLIVRLADPPLAAYVGNDAKRLGFRVSAAQQRAYLQQLAQKQNQIGAQIQAMGGRELARVSKAHNALIFEIDAARATAVAAIPGVTTIRPVIDYQLSLSTTVPYIGASALQAAGVDGTGITVAVLDSGIDYTHRNLGGPGTAAAYLAAYGASPTDTRNRTLDGLFPTAKVIGGFDFVGEVWPNGDLAPDPDPIDLEGHGTHVADIIAGFSASPLHKGVAPGASLLAIKTCSSISTACSGIALLQGLDFALDPNGHGDLLDAADVINMSLGSAYGQREDDISEAATIVSSLGVVVVAASGNDGDRPYITSSPAVTPAVISVAETQVPTAVSYPLVIQSPSAIAGSYTNTATVEWAPIVGVTTGAVAYVGSGCPADGATPEDPYLANPAGKIALIDRGTCTISIKVDRAARAGAIAVLIGLIASGDAVSFSSGGGTRFVPTLVITQSTANLIRANIAAPVVATLSASNAIPLVGSMVASSARGPGYSYNSIKPDIGAPGASVSAIAGSGTGQEAFGGTSGATPMISGSAALLLQAFPGETVNEIKARLINTAETAVYLNPATQPGFLAPITRISGGEVRVDRARNTSTAAWDAGDPASVTLSFATTRAAGISSFKKKVLVRNYSASARTYSISPAFRYSDDASTGAVAINVPASLTVPANSSSTFVATLTLDASRLAPWALNGGAQGGNGPLLQTYEYDGYLNISGGGDNIHLPWQILPHQAANLAPPSTTFSLGGAPSAPLSLTNMGASTSGRVDVFSLTGTSSKLPVATLPRPGDNYTIIDLKAVGVRLVNVGGGTLGVQFAINTWGERAHPNYPAEFDVVIDVNNDGKDDFVIYNSENGGFAASGQNVVSVVNLATNITVTRFFTDADLNSSNIILTALLSDLGLNSASAIHFSVYAFDNYFTGALTDVIANSVYRLDSPRFLATGVPAAIAPNGSATLTINNLGNAVVSPSQSGLLLMYRDAKSGHEADAITITP